MKGKAYKVASVAIVVATGYLSLELVSYLALSLVRHLSPEAESQIFFEPLSRKSLELVIARPPYRNFDRILGWAIQPNTVGCDGACRSNSQGIRADVEYGPSPAKGKIRIGGFGSSYIHGSDVRNSETILAQWEAIEPKIETLNFGVDNYGIDQTLLNYRQRQRMFRFDVVLIGWNAGDLDRPTRAMRYFGAERGKLPYPKPRFVYSNAKLELVPVPLDWDSSEKYYRLLQDHPEDFWAWVRRWDSTSHHSLPSTLWDLFPSLHLGRMLGAAIVKERYVAHFTPGDEALELTKRLLSTLYRAVLENGTAPLIVITQGRSGLLAERAGKTRQYQPVIEFLKQEGMQYVDISDAISKAPNIEKLTLERTHYSPEGNRLAATVLQKWFHEQGWFDTGKRSEHIKLAKSRMRKD